MHSDANTRQYIESLAREALRRFEDIETEASKELRRSAPHGNVLAYPNPAAEADVRRRRQEVREGVQQPPKGTGGRPSSDRRQRSTADLVHLPRHTNHQDWKPR